MSHARRVSSTADKTQEGLGELIATGSDSAPALSLLEKIFYLVAASIKALLRTAHP
jgi:hypothetical protein